MTKRSNIRLSVVLATRNEEANIGLCLKSVKDMFADLPAQAGEIIIFDENSTDKTVEIAKKYGAKVTNYVNKTNFHETKQKAIEAARGDWILQLDADERVSTELAREILEVIASTNEALLDRVLSHPEQDGSTSRHPGATQSRVIGSNNEHPDSIAKRQGLLIASLQNEKTKLFKRHESLIREREGGLGKPTGEIAAFFIPRVNYFVGQPLVHAGVYPDGVIRLIKQGKARLPAKSVHEVMEVDGEVGWLFNDLEHHESPTLRRYIERANRYTDLTAKELKEKGVAKNNWQIFSYTIIKPKITFLKLYFRYKGYKDGIRGFLWSFFSAMHKPIAYWKYYVEN